MNIHAIDGAENSVGALLRDWRAKRRMSQLDLASEAGISQRHLSFVESGRSLPSREQDGPGELDETGQQQERSRDGGPRKTQRAKRQRSRRRERRPPVSRPPARSS